MVKVQIAFDTIPHEKGVYILILRVEELLNLSIGSLGSVTVKPGLYAYVGSARSFGGLRSRIKHHLMKGKKRLWWHIDYLTSHSNVKILCIIYGLTRLDLEECLAEALSKSSCWRYAIPGFGSSDKRSYSHLFSCVCSTSQCLDDSKKALQQCVGVANAICFNI